MSQKQNKKQKLIDSARELFHVRGYTHTSIADIAHNAEVPIGNVYYYFKTKAELAEVIIKERIDFMKEATASVHQQNLSPAEAVQLLFETVKPGIPNVVQNGCPIGGLSLELNKIEPDLAAKNAEILKLQSRYLETQFRRAALEAPKKLALHIMNRWQGAALMSNSLQDPQVLEQEIETILRDVHIALQV